MKGKKTSTEQAIRILREIEVLKGQGQGLQKACRKLNLSYQPICYILLAKAHYVRVLLHN